MQNYQKNTWIAIGVMSGTSVDGLDMVAVKFHNDISQWQYEVIKAVSIDYPTDLKNRLINCIHVSGEELVYLDLELGIYIGMRVSEFLKDLNIKVDLIASHGHTVFHQPENGMTKQIGDGQSILSETGILTVNDFRTMDVIKGGQGAPLVPIGDQYLFPEFEVCLNIGGFSNISYSDKNGNRLAFDTGPANLLLNYLARKLGYNYDSNGDIARKGKLIKKLYDQLNELTYYELSPPKSLGLEWVKEKILPELENDQDKIEDLMHTCVKHISFHINQAIIKEAASQQTQLKNLNILVTGGGTYNQFLIESLKQDHKELNFVLPSKETIDFKEAIIFAFLGVLRLNKQINVINSVTGAEVDSIGGTIHDNI
jgi:anhydro-N-acetylmuramic acid kinase